MERLKKALLIAASSLLFCFPVYADEPEAADLPIEEVNHDIELINDSTKEASEVPIDNLVEIQGGMLRSPSINPNEEFRYLNYSLSKIDDDTVKFDVIFQGVPPTGFAGFQLAVSQNQVWSYPILSGGTGYSKEFDLPVYIHSIQYVIDGSPTGNIFLDLTLNEENIDSIINNQDVSNVGIASYLSFVGTVFTWLLTTIGTLISFILGNPFLAVSLLLFMAGAVISFYARIKNS